MKLISYECDEALNKHKIQKNMMFWVNNFYIQSSYILSVLEKEHRIVHWKVVGVKLELPVNA